MTSSCGQARGQKLCWYSRSDKLVNLLSFLQAFQRNYFLPSIQWARQWMSADYLGQKNSLQKCKWDWIWLVEVLKHLSVCELWLESAELKWKCSCVNSIYLWVRKTTWVDTGLSLAQSYHVTWILDFGWSRVILHGYFPLLGQCDETTIQSLTYDTSDLLMTQWWPTIGI